MMYIIEAKVLAQSSKVLRQMKTIKAKIMMVDVDDDKARTIK